MNPLSENKILLIFNDHYDFLEKLANSSSNCHNYLNEEALASFPIFRDDIIYASTCCIYNGNRLHDYYDIEEGKYNPNHYIRTLITIIGIYQFNAVYNEKVFIPWSEFDIHEFQYEYLVGNTFGKKIETSI